MHVFGIGTACTDISQGDKGEARQNAGVGGRMDEGGQLTRGGLCGQVADGHACVMRTQRAALRAVDQQNVHGRLRSKVLHTEQWGF